MYKASLAMILILFNVAPLLAGFKIFGYEFHFFGRKPTTARPLLPVGRNRTNHTYYQRRCDGGRDGICVYPRLCFCTKPKPGPYIRLPPDEFPWYYDYKTNKCLQTEGSHFGCNRFTTIIQCWKDCLIPLRRLRQLKQKRRRYK
uniref:Putative monolaris n=1 Tax=Rhipicephalus pulchellus TaxID=72859 RepID=L7M9N6_RHIPC